MKSAEEQLAIIRRGVVEIIPEEGLSAKLKTGKPLKVKWGADPSAPDIHLGHTVVLHKLRQLQDLGHHVEFIIGDFTAMIGDPSGKSAARKPLDKDVVEKNSASYQEQVFKILDRGKTTVHKNSAWLKNLKLEEIFKLTSFYTVARMLERNDFKKRFESEAEISVLEFLYPLLQGYDSVQLDSDIEIGGTDQKFNMLVGRTLKERYSKMAQVVLTLPLLEGTDGVNKMSKSLGNYIGITEPPAEIFGKVMSISDTLMLRYYELLTDEDLAAVKKMHPKAAKMKLAGLLVSRFHDAKAARSAEQEFETVFKSGGKPQEIDLIELNEPEMNIIDLLAETKLAPSRSEARRLVQQGGVSVNDTVIKDEKALIGLKNEIVLQVGKRRFLRVKAT
ncbi:MAG: tyrosine--tRNA ligase [Candidatus Saganbacteria bacterium]|nr:tyrosine--tRNA ligase [Candidatus Saganbacteria bacterium]